MKGPAIELRQLAVSFHGRSVLQNIDLAIPPRAITTLIGPSGSGKTTLLRAINRLNECYAGCRTTGSVWLGNDGDRRDIYAADYPLATLRRQAGMCFQHPNPLPGSIASNFAIPLHCVLGLARSAIEERMRQALRDVDLYQEVADRLHASALTLSGGQQQRLCLARALALEPSYLLLDEPTANLDYRSSAKVEELLLQLKTRYTIVAVSHSLSQARRLADQVCLLREGTLAQLFDRRQMEDANTFYRMVEAQF